MDKKKPNRKIILGVGALLTCVVIVALCSFFPFIIDPSGWQTAEFLSDELIIVSITIFSIVCLNIIGQAENAQNPKSNIAKAKVAFADTLGKVKDEGIAKFGQWVRRKFQKDDLKHAKQRELIKEGIEDMSVLEMSDAEIDSLIGSPKEINGHWHRGLTKKQAKAAKRIKGMRIKLVDATYYLSDSKRGGGNKTITERSGGEDGKKAGLLSYSIISRSAMSVVIAMIFASLIYDSNSGIQQAEAWMKFASRMFSMATSGFMGYTVGCQTNDIDADYISMRSIVHETFLQDHSYVFITEEEELREMAERDIIKERKEDGDGKQGENH